MRHFCDILKMEYFLRLRHLVFNQEKLLICGKSETFLENT